MENQPTDTDDLTHPEPDCDAASDHTDASTQSEDSPAADPALDTTSVAGRRDRWLVGALAVSVVLFIGSGVYFGFALHSHLADRALGATKAEIARTAVAAVTTLWTYTPDTIETLPDRAGEYLSGDLNAQYRQFLEAAIAPNKQAQITDKTEVVGVAVESLNGTDSVALVLTNTTATSPLTKNIPSLKYVAYRLALTKQDSRWRVTKMATVSFTDLTPKI